MIKFILTLLLICICWPIGLLIVILAPIFAGKKNPATAHHTALNILK